MKNYITPPHTNEAASAHKHTGRAVVIAPPPQVYYTLKDIGKNGNLKTGPRRDIYLQVINHARRGFDYSDPEGLNDDLTKKLKLLELAEKGFTSLRTHNKSLKKDNSETGKAKKKRSLAAGDYDEDLIALNAYLDSIDRKTFKAKQDGLNTKPGKSKPGSDG